jgi:integrase
MTTAAPSTALATIQPAFTDPERLALAGFLPDTEAWPAKRVPWTCTNSPPGAGPTPAAHVRRPRVGYESHAVALDRNELGALLVAGGLGSPAEHALISLLALNGLRVSEATGTDIEHLGLERGHRTLTIARRAARSSPSR